MIDALATLLSAVGALAVFGSAFAFLVVAIKAAWDRFKPIPPRGG